jgi:hypothetical protein
MKTASLKLSLYSVLCFLLCARGEGETHPKLAKLFDAGDSVHVTGIWMPDVRTKEGESAPAVMDYRCYRYGGTELVGTKAFCLEVRATRFAGTIHIDTDFLRVITWTKTVIETTTDDGDPNHLPCVISQVTFNLGLKTVTDLDSKKLAASRFDLCKGLLDHVSYTLYDKIDDSFFGKNK